MKFSPEITTGTIIQIAVILVSAVLGFAAVKTELATQKVEIEANKVAAARDNQMTAKAIDELKVEVKEQAKTLSDIKESLAILRGRSSESSGKR